MFKIFAGNLNFKANEDDLTEFFKDLGYVPDKVTFISDRDTAQFRGFGFVDFNNVEEGRRALKAAEGQEFMGRQINVSEARPREARSGTDGGGGAPRGQGPSKYSDRRGAAPRDTEWT